MLRRMFDKVFTTAIRRRMLRLHVFAALVLIILVAGIQFGGLAQTREQYVERAQLSAQNLGNVLTDAFAGFFGKVDISLLAVIDQVRLQERSGGPESITTDGALSALKNQVPGLTGLRITNAEGVVQFGTDLDQIGHYSVADRDYFLRLKADPRLPMIVSEPLVSRSVNKWALVCARAYYRADGRFGGIVFATIAVDHLLENVLGQTPDLGEQGVFALVDDQQNNIFRYRYNRLDVGSIGTKLTSPEIRKLVAARVESANYTDRWKLDPIERIVYFKRVRGVPMAVAVGLGADEVLSGWRHDAWIGILTVVVFSMVVAGSSALLYRQRLRHLRTLEELAGALNFNEQIIEHSEIGICVHRQDGLCVMANSALEKIVGATHEQLLQVNFRELNSLKQVGGLELAEQTLANGSTHRVQGRVRTLFGKEMWLQWVFASFVDRGKRFLLVLIRDITDIQTAREELETSNRKLAVLSTTDGLTDIANRRYFDEMLASEWKRATRQRLPLALAMIDVDLFKKYNDHYGHQGGDECLRQVAALMKRHVARAGDLVARYGGEEFAFICPATAGEGAEALAEGLRAALEQLALPHAESPFGIVTVSIGVASMIPEDGETADFSLLHQADEALYLAKRNGRNRVVLADPPH